MIHVCFSLHDEDGRYSKFTGTAILSMFENTNEKVAVHILHDKTLTDNNREKFLILAERYGQIINFYNVEKICANEIESINQLFAAEHNREGFSMGKFYRLLTPQIFSDIEKIIYLDSDIIVNLDINELWQINLGDKPIAAVPENENGQDILKHIPSCQNGIVDFKDYFNSGVLIINLQQICKSELENIREKMIFRSQNPQYIYYDQEILNYCFSKNYFKLANKFNFYVRDAKKRGEFNTKNRICHYLALSLNLNMKEDYNRLWFSCFEKTPWFTKEIIQHIDEGYKKIINQRDVVHLKDLALQLSALMSGKTRAFFADVSDIEPMKKIFYVRDDEEIIQFVNQKSFQILADAMYNFRGEKLFFILFRDYEQLQSALTGAGFVEGCDFINAEIFLSKEKEDEHLDTYQIVRGM